MLDSRYDDLKSGRVRPISGDEMKARACAREALDVKPRAEMTEYGFHPERSCRTRSPHGDIIM